MKFKDIIQRHLLTEGRSKSLTRGETIEILRNNCQKAIKEYDQIWRGYIRDPFDGWHGYVDPSKYTRQSANTKNYYTLLMDNLPQWEKFPKRSKSIICTTSEDAAMNYGQAYMILPFDNAEIAVCPEYDIWISFEKNLYEFNNSIEACISSILNEPPNERDFESLKRQMQQITKEQIKDKVDSSYKFDALDLFSWLGNDKNENLFSIASKTLNTKEFKLVQPGTLLSGLSGVREVWTEGPCVILHPFEEKILNEV